MLAFFLSAALLLLPPSVRGSQLRQPLIPHMGFMTSYSFNPPLMKGWVTHGLDFYCELFPDCRSKPTGWWQLNASLAAWDRWNIPSLYSGLPTGYSDKATETGVFVRGVGLAMGWEAAMERIFTTQIQPNMGPDKALRGVFIGDELCCGPTPAKCWADGFGPLTRKLRALIGPDMIIYTNECAGEFDPIHNNDTAMNITEVPPDFDLISLDVYADYLPPALPAENRSNEVAMAKPFYESLFSRMQPHQRAVLVPGTFACSNATSIGGKGVRAVHSLRTRVRDVLLVLLLTQLVWLLPSSPAVLGPILSPGTGTCRGGKAQRILHLGEGRDPHSWLLSLALQHPLGDGRRRQRAFDCGYQQGNPVRYGVGGD